MSWTIAAFGAVTKLGNLAILVPLSAVMLGWQLALRPKGAAWSWLAACLVCAGGIGLLKILLYACLPFSELRSPSGHTSLSTLVYGGFVAVIAADLGAWRRWLMIGAGAALVLAIAFSRVVVHAHSWLEVLLGLAVGVGCLIAFSLLYLPRRGDAVPMKTFALCVLVIWALLYSHPVNAEGLIHRISDFLSARSLICHR